MQPPCPAEEIRHAEQVVGYPFPKELCELLQELNGDHYCLLSTLQIIENVERNRESWLLLFEEDYSKEQYTELVDRFIFLCDQWLRRLLLLPCQWKWCSRWNSYLHLGAWISWREMLEKGCRKHGGIYHQVLPRRDLAIMFAATFVGAARVYIPPPKCKKIFFMQRRRPAFCRRLCREMFALISTRKASS